jgi:hypothetical protein
MLARDFGIGLACAGLQDFFVGTFAWTGIFLIIGVGALYTYYQFKRNQ